MKPVACIVLAAGKGTRMKSSLTKVMHPCAGVPMIDYPVSAASISGASPVVVVTGHQGDAVREHLSGRAGLLCAVQEEQLGTGHAVACARQLLEGFDGTVLIVCGDTPLLTEGTLRKLMDYHAEKESRVTVLSAILEDPHGYGRILRGPAGELQGIVEQKDASSDQKEIREINSGIYCVEASFLFNALESVTNRNAQGEYYLTDIVGIAVSRGLPCHALAADDADEIMGVNDRAQLAEASRIIRNRVNRRLMLDGVTISDPSHTYIEPQVSIGADTEVHPNVSISGNTSIGRGCLIESGVSIRSCNIGSNVHIKAGSVLEESEINDFSSVGPMAHLRPGTVLGAHVKIGNFVETKKAVMGENSKASHLTYLGDAEIGRDVNIGCGTITCNYDGVRKHKTVIGDEVFIGSDVQLVAPVTVGRNSLVAAGTTVTSDVPPDSLAISRTPQINKEGWRLKKR